VTNFFTVMNEHEDFKDGFNNPDPENLEPKDSTEQEGEKVRKKVKFCTYWAVSHCREVLLVLVHWSIC